MALDVIRLAAHLRIGDGVNPPPQPLRITLEDIHDAAAELVAQYAPSAPILIQNIAIVRVVGYLYEVDPANARGPQNAITQSGAAAILAPYVAPDALPFDSEGEENTGEPRDPITGPAGRDGLPGPVGPGYFHIFRLIPEGTLAGIAPPITGEFNPLDYSIANVPAGWGVEIPAAQAGQELIASEIFIHPVLHPMPFIPTWSRPFLYGGADTGIYARQSQVDVIAQQQQLDIRRINAIDDELVTITGTISDEGERITANTNAIARLQTGSGGDPDPDPSGDVNLPPFEQEDVEVLHSRAGVLYWEGVDEVPNTPGTQSGIGHVLTVTGENDKDYNWRAPGGGGLTPEQLRAIADNTAKVGITQDQARAIAANTEKVGITENQANAITANENARWPGEALIQPSAIEDVAAQEAINFSVHLHRVDGSYPNGTRHRISLGGRQGAFVSIANPARLPSTAAEVLALRNNGAAVGFVRGVLQIASADSDAVIGSIDFDLEIIPPIVRIVRLANEAAHTALAVKDVNTIYWWPS